MLAKQGVIGGVLLAFLGVAQAGALITEDEARQPGAQEAPRMLTRAITRGPSIKQLSPEPSVPVKSPFNLKLAFEPHGGASIDPASVTVTYLKATPVDLTPRLQKGVSATGLEMANAEVPPGEHQIRLTVKDNEGRQSSSVIQLNVAR